MLEIKTQKKYRPGNAQQQGAVLTHDGVNFAVYSKYSDAVFLLLFDDQSSDPTDVIPLTRQGNDIWSVFVSGLKAGQMYGYKVSGPFHPQEAKRYNSNKLLIDPYAKAISHKAFNHDGVLYGYVRNHTDEDLSWDERDSSLKAPKSIVVDDVFDWGDDTRPNIPNEELIIYETHLKGFTAHPSSQVDSAGTYKGFIEKIPYLKDLGINAVEFMPIMEFYHRDGLIENGLSEYWGYNTIAFMSPELSYASKAKPGIAVLEFKEMVKAMHAAGLEVILDIVLNHTGETNHNGPTLMFRGVDNGTYYALKGEDGAPYRFYRDELTGCGNQLNFSNPQVRTFAYDVLKYWVQEMRVDGFRFDLAPVLAYEDGKFNPKSEFIKQLTQDPVFKNIKLIAEPWDLKGYHYNQFPEDFFEWNDQFRNTMRKFLNRHQISLGDVAESLTGTNDDLPHKNKSVINSVNYITSHDGFTLLDLFSYKKKHNQSNQEHNKDGTDWNFSCNCNVEGFSNDPKIKKLRRRLMKNAYSIILLSSGTPMLLYGDEIGRTQLGNNNAYCQDNEISWVNWDRQYEFKCVRRFVQAMIQWRKRFVHCIQDCRDHQWFNEKLKEPQWDNGRDQVLGYELPVSEKGREEHYFLYFILNSRQKACNVQLPAHDGFSWYRVMDTSRDSPDDLLESGHEIQLKTQDKYLTAARSHVLLLAKAKTS